MSQPNSPRSPAHVLVDAAPHALAMTEAGSQGASSSHGPESVFHANLPGPSKTESDQVKQEATPSDKEGDFSCDEHVTGRSLEVKADNVTVRAVVEAEPQVVKDEKNSEIMQIVKIVMEEGKQREVKMQSSIEEMKNELREAKNEVTKIKEETKRTMGNMSNTSRI